MKDRKLATRYARALFTALPDPASAEAAETQLTALAQAIGRSPELHDVLWNPAVPRSAKKAVLLRLAQSLEAGREVRNFLGVLVDHARASQLPEVAEAFHQTREQELGILRATIATAFPMSPETEERARAALQRVTGKKIRLASRVDRSLLGGAVTTIGSTVYDGSIRTQLATLRRRMAGEQG